MYVVAQSHLCLYILHAMYHTYVPYQRGLFEPKTIHLANGACGNAYLIQPCFCRVPSSGRPVVAIQQKKQAPLNFSNFLSSSSQKILRPLPWNFPFPATAALGGREVLRHALPVPPWQPWAAGAELERVKRRLRWLENDWKFSRSLGTFGTIVRGLGSTYPYMIFYE